MNRLTNEEAAMLQPLTYTDPLVCKKAVGFTLTPASNVYPAPLSGAQWEDITYYADPNTDYTVYPLEIMLNEWSIQKDQLNGNLTV